MTDGFRIDDLNENQVLTITASDQLTKEDYSQLLPELEQWWVFR